MKSAGQASIDKGTILAMSAPSTERVEHEHDGEWFRGRGGLEDSDSRVLRWSAEPLQQSRPAGPFVRCRTDLSSGKFEKHHKTMA